MWCEVVNITYAVRYCATELRDVLSRIGDKEGDSEWLVLEVLDCERESLVVGEVELMIEGEAGVLFVLVRENVEVVALAYEVCFAAFEILAWSVSNELNSLWLRCNRHRSDKNSGHQ